MDKDEIGEAIGKVVDRDGQAPEGGITTEELTRLLAKEDTGECGTDHKTVPRNTFGGYIICDNCGTKLGEWR